MTIEVVSPPSAAEVRAALERIAESPQFRASFRLIAFLRYVVELTLVSHPAQIKGYTVAVEALGRHPSFDPQADPIVRVEAGRLRRALAHYYAGAGSDDPFAIDLPRGSYVPLFRRREMDVSSGPASRGERGDFADLAGTAAINRRSVEQAALQAVCDRLVALRRQIDAMAAEIEIASMLLQRLDHAPRRRT